MTGGIGVRPSPADSYSPELRTALVLTGTGTAGAYHAGALRALHEAGVKLDIVAGRGIGAVGGPLDAHRAIDHCWNVMWDLVRGAAQVKPPSRVDLGRRYTEMLAENL